MTGSKLSVTFVVGPTASGKSEMALQWAEEHHAVIVNCDSVQVYDHVFIGAAKPTAEELARVPHWLYSFVPAPQELTAGSYRREFFLKMQELERQGVRDALVVGGTGFYFQALEKGLFEIEKTPLEVEQQLLHEASTPEGINKLYLELKEKDPRTADKIHPHDQYRLMRALQIIRGSGRRPSELWEQKKAQSIAFPYPLRKIGVAWERAELHQRIQNRVNKMLREGLIDEVDQLLKKGIPSEWAPLKSVGYKETQAYLCGELGTLSALEEAIIISTRQLAKRQITWFKRDSAIHWIPGPHIETGISDLLRALPFLSRMNRGINQ